LRASAPPGVSTVAQANLIPALRQLEAGMWREASESGAISGVKVFADRLSELGRAAGCAPLQTYAAALQHEAEVYAILRMETRLKDYPGLIQSLETPPADSPTETIRSSDGRS
jgi:hypothetical protein